MSAVSPAVTDAPPRRARIAVIIFFMLHGLTFASWIVRIPDVKVQLGLSDGELGLALLGAPVGAVAGQFLVGWLISKYGSKRITIWMAVAWSLIFPLLGLAPQLFVLMFFLFLSGVVTGGFDVAMNAQAATVEKLYKRPIMANFHGTWSVASLIAAGIGGYLAGRAVPVEWHFLGVSAFVLVVTVFAQRDLVAEERPESTERHSFALLPKALLPLGMIAFSVLLFEGAISDWSAVYLRETLDSPPTEAAAAFVVFNLLMTAGRLTGDALTLRLGSSIVVRAGGVLALAGLLIFVLSPWPLLAISGCALIGAGLAMPFPLVISAAAGNVNVPPGRAISSMATVGYAGNLLGPPLIGSVSELVSLRGALGLLCLASLTLILLSSYVQQTNATKVAAEA